MRHASVSSVESAPRRIRSASNPLRKFVNTRARFGVALFGVFCGMLPGTSQKAHAAGWKLLRTETQGGTTVQHIDAKSAQQVPPNGLAAQHSTYDWPATITPPPPPFPFYPIPPSDVTFTQDANIPLLPSPARNAEGVGAYVKSEGQVRGVYQWQRSDPNDSPPQYVTFNISASAGGYAFNVSTPVHDASKETASATAWGKDGISVVGPSSTTVPSYTSVSATNTSYIMATTANDQVASPWVDLKAHSELAGGRSAPANYSSGGSGYVYFPGAVQAQVSVTISSPLSKYVTVGRSGSPAPKLESDPTLDKTKEEWVASDGTRHGHTRWSYKERVNTSTPLVGNYADNSVNISQVITATQSSGWSSNIAGVWSPLGSQDTHPPQNTGATHIVDVPDTGSLYNPEGLEFSQISNGVYANVVDPGWYNVSNGGGEISSTYTLTDNANGFQSKATYALQPHNEWENAIDDSPAQTSAPWIVDLNVPRINGPRTAEPWTFFNLTAGLKITLSTNFGADFKLKDWFNIGGDFKAEGSLDISVHYNASSPSVDIGEDQSALPCVRFIRKTQHKLVDHFTVAGWDRNSARTDGKHTKSADLPINIQDVSADWHILGIDEPA